MSSDTHGPVERLTSVPRMSLLFKASWASLAAAGIATGIGARRTISGRPGGPVLTAAAGSLLALGVRDVLQRGNSVERNHPVLGHLRYLSQELRPELRQYFIEDDTDGKPFSHNERQYVNEQADDSHEEMPFGTELDVAAPGYEWFAHSVAARPTPEAVPRVTVGGPQCRQPYAMALLNVSAMSFGSLSGPAITALNEGARRGGFAHDTGEGGISPYHRQGGDLVMEIGTAYFGVRTDDGGFDPEKFREKSRDPQVRAVSVKLSQGAKPGLGGVMPASKVTEEIAEIRGVPAHEKCVSPPSHSTFDTPEGLLRWIADLREMSGGRPTGFKLCIGRRTEFLAIVKAMRTTEVLPDFVIVDGAEGGTGAAPLTFEDHGGMPLADALPFVDSALRGAGLRDHVRVGCAGKVVTGFDLVRALALGADYANAARTMMFALGCIQARRCHTNTCPVGVTSHDPNLTRGLVVEDKAARVANYQRNVVQEAMTIISSMGLDGPADVDGTALYRHTGTDTYDTLANINRRLDDGSLLDGSAPEQWLREWSDADPTRF